MAVIRNKDRLHVLARAATKFESPQMSAAAAVQVEESGMTQKSSDERKGTFGMLLLGQHGSGKTAFVGSLFKLPLTDKPTTQVEHFRKDGLSLIDTPEWPLAEKMQRELDKNIANTIDCVVYFYNANDRVCRKCAVSPLPL
jgi:septin family protein